jgi:hypothetical protein
LRVDRVPALHAKPSKRLLTIEQAVRDTLAAQHASYTHVNTSAHACGDARRDRDRQTCTRRCMGEVTRTHQSWRPCPTSTHAARACRVPLRRCLRAVKALHDRALDAHIPPPVLRPQHVLVAARR